MLDRSLESRLRSALQAEGDSLALTITAAELERRLELRGRSGPGRFASLGVAAAVALALVGLSAAAGGWFEQRSSSPPATASVMPSIPPSAGPSASAPGTVPLLPSLEALLDQADRNRVVRAQAVGPSGGPGSEGDPVGDRIEPGSIEWAPVRLSGTYRLSTACASDGDLVVETGSGTLSGTTVSCDGAITSRDLTLGAGDRVRIGTTTSVAWRAVLEAPPRTPLQAPTFQSEFDVLPDGWTSLGEDRSGPASPSYGEPEPSDSAERTSFGVPNRERYKVLYSCAGPQPISYSFGGTFVGPDDVAVPLEYLRTVAECDGGVHVDTIDIPLGGAEVSVSSDPRVAWHLMVLAETPPIAAPENDPIWTTSSVSGPNLEARGQGHVISTPTGEPGEDVRVIVSCEGDGPLKVTTDTGAVEGERLDTFEVPCEIGKPATIARVYTKMPGHMTATFDPGGKPMWIVFATQVRR